MTKNKTIYEVALSFAGEDRKYVHQVAEELKRRKVSFFYDEYEQADLWGKDLYQHLSGVYSTHAKYTIIFISKNYANKLWTKHEMKSAQAKAFQESNEYILPARFDGTDLPGVLPTVGYIDLNKLSPSEFAGIIMEKLNSDLGIDFKHKEVKRGEFQNMRRSLLTIRNFNMENREFLFDLSQYHTFDEILNDLFIHYLKGLVKPFTYGSEWILTSQMGFRYLAPIEFVVNFPEPIINYLPNWTQDVGFEEIELLPGNVIELEMLKKHRKDYFYGVYTNNNSLAEILNKDPKAISYFVNNKQFVNKDSLEEERNYLYKLVYGDWLSVVNNRFLIDNGNEIKETSQRRFLK
ncbi:toll/interleukin-1 receptor domain-containing protein [Flagellimonas sp.]|uniref:toll/interleukin-1 receptor domain-containing protein n=1 Tax=Flagellimonas sp. TaxID=2058762 RepID=UPI003BAADB9A